MPGAAILLLLAGPVAPAQAASTATTRYVSTTGLDKNDCAYVPCKTIQYAVDQSIDGDQVLIAAGTYTGPVLLSGISLTLSGTGANQTIVDGQRADVVVEVESGSVVTLSNVTLQNGLHNAGGGIYLQEARLTLIDAGDKVYVVNSTWGVILRVGIFYPFKDFCQPEEFLLIALHSSIHVL
jgi:hypothetical protein